ncbi:MAG TPA: hypothetical protein VFJ12_14975 [Segeticoccus sp.]|nr:hypothetical protein [Segeticoccus sp.]
MAGEHQVKALLQLVSGVGDLTRARAQDTARGLMELPGGESAGRLTGQVAALADELLATATANRENLLGLVRSEVEAAVARLGLARDAQGLDVGEELERLRQENASLRAKLELREAAEASAGRRGSGTAKSTRRAGTGAGTSTSSARKRSTSRAAKRPVARSTPERAPAATPSRKRPTAKQTTSKQGTSKQGTSKQAPAKRATAKRATSKRSTGRSATGDGGTGTGSRRGTSTTASRRGDAEQG